MYKRNGIREYNVGNFRLLATVHLYYQFVKFGIDFYLYEKKIDVYLAA